jgi:hypothetical protein
MAITIPTPCQRVTRSRSATMASTTVAAGSFIGFPRGSRRFPLIAANTSTTAVADSRAKTLTP